MPVDELTGFLWRELGRTMRRFRRAADVSIRAAEQRSGYSRGMLSLAENGKARPGRTLVRWYDEAFAADGLLLSLYAEALTAALPSATRTGVGSGVANGDSLELDHADPASGVVVAPGARLAVCWTLRNTGRKRWKKRRLERLGAMGGSLVLASARHLDVPDTPSGALVSVECELVAPGRPGSYIGCWALLDAAGSLPSERALVYFAVVVE